MKKKSTAIILTMAPADDEIYEWLKAEGFTFGHTGVFRNYDNMYERFNYWTVFYDAKQIIIGFRDPDAKPVCSGDLVL